MSYTYQTRAADEAPTTVVSCPKCVLDSTRIAHTRPPPVHIPPRAWKTSANSRTYIDVNTSGIVYTRVECTLMKEPLDTRYVVHKHRDYRVLTSAMGKDQSGHYGKVRIDPKNGMTLFETSSTLVAPNVKVLKYKECTIDTNAASLMVNGMHYIHYEERSNSEIYQVVGTGHAVFSVEMHFLTDSRVLSIIDEAYSLGACPERFHNFAPKDLIPRLFLSSAHAYDATEVDGDEYVFTTKVDGERMWACKVGSVWLYVRRLLNGVVVMWKTLNSVREYAGIGAVYDVESTMLSRPVFIDTLVDVSGTVMSSTHSLDEAIDEFKKDIDATQTFFLRKYKHSVSSAERYSKTIGYSNDGIVAISKLDRTTYKLKEMRAIELVVREDGNLYSGDGYLIANISAAHSFNPGDIVELRFKVKDEKIHVTSVFSRPDKLTANDRTACMSIIECMGPSGISNASVRMYAVRWSRSVTSHLITQMNDSSTPFRVIMDIGSGDGVTVGEYIAVCKSRPVLFVEPSMAKYSKLNSTIGCHTVLDVSRVRESIMKLSGGYSTKVGKFLAIRATIEEILNDEAAMDAVKRYVCGFIFSFSANHTHLSMGTLYSLGYRVYGCGYVYDDVDDNGVLIENYGVSMRTLSKDEAVVVWGGDTEYREFPIRLKDFHRNVRKIRALDVIPLPLGAHTDLCVDIAQHVHMFM